MPSSNVKVITGKAAREAAEAMSRRIAEEQAELDRRGAKTYEAVILLPDGGYTSAVTGDEAAD